MLADWLVILAAAVTPLLAYAGVLQGNRRARKRDVEDRAAAVEEDHRIRREQTLAQLQWACNHSTSDNPRASEMGVAALSAMKAAGLLERQDELVLDAVLDVMLALPLSRLAETPGARVAQLATIETIDPASAKGLEEA